MPIQLSFGCSPIGVIHPLIKLNFGLGTTLLISIFICVPSPSHAVQAPRGELNEKNLGSNSSKELLHFIQDRFSLNRYSLLFVVSIIITPLPSFSPNSIDAVSLSVTLGVMPSYSFNGKGMKIDVVIDGRPGSVAGLKGGDIIIKMQDYNIADIYSYMEALGKFKKGDNIYIVVLRDKVKREFKVVF